MSSAGPVLGVRGSLFQEFQVAFWRPFKTLFEIRGKASPGPLNWAPRGPLVPIQNYIAPVGRPADWFCALFALCLEVLPQSKIKVLPCVHKSWVFSWHCLLGLHRLQSFPFPCSIEVGGALPIRRVVFDLVNHEQRCGKAPK